MPRQRIDLDTIEEAVERIIQYLVDTSSTAHRVIYFDGWCGLAASAVLRAIAKEPPPSLVKRFNKIIHVDCSRWKSRRALQRAIAQELRLPRPVMDVLDRQDEEDDFRGVDEGSRAEIRDVGAAINGEMREHTYLLVFNNGSENTVDLNDFGIPLSVWDSTRVLWTFRGRLRLNSKISEKVDISHLYLHAMYSTHGWNYLLQKEATEISRYTDVELGGAAEDCCSYLLSLNSLGGNIMDYNWATHASNYWVCDGIIEGGQANKAWEVAAALHQQIHLDDYLSNALPSFGEQIVPPRKRWVFARDNSLVMPLPSLPFTSEKRDGKYWLGGCPPEFIKEDMGEITRGTETLRIAKITEVFQDNSAVPSESTSFFLDANESIFYPSLGTLPNGMFHQSDKLHVLKLCNCTFSFSLPPFRCCRNLRFLGLDGCKDIGTKEVDKQDRPVMDFVKCLWVIDICCTNWELDLSPENIEQIVANIREIHIKKGCFWHMSFAWRQLRSLHKLRVIDPTCSWEMGGNDGFAVLPSLSTSNNLKSLILDGCLGLEHVKGLPLTLESFSLDAGLGKEPKIICISLDGCARLSDFKLHGSLPNLEELDLSGTKVKTLDLTTKVVRVPCLKRVMLLGCEKLCAVLWPQKGVPQLSLLQIDTRGGNIKRISPDLHKLKMGCGQAYFSMVDMKFIQLLVRTSDNMFWNTDSDGFSLNLCISASGRWCNYEKMGSRSSGKLCRPPSLIPKHSYTSLVIDDITIDHGRNKSEVQFQPSGYHVEIGDGISNTSMESIQGITCAIFVMNKTKSLHVHDNSSITTAIPGNMVYVEGQEITWNHLKQCQVVGCPKMRTVFTTNYNPSCFEEIDTFWAADLLMVHCIWGKGRTIGLKDTSSFAKLRSIHLYSCPRLTFVLSLSWAAPDSYFPNLEILHIVNCGDLKDVFPVEPEFLTIIATDHREGVLNFPKLKQIYLHELPKLHHICETKVLAPMLETIWLRGCWSLRRLPPVGLDNRRRPVVNCEKDWWKKLEWDGLEAGHDPSLYFPRHSSYYKKRLPRVSVLR